MIADLSAAVAESIAAPRRSVRRYLERGPHGIDVLFGLILGAYLVQQIAALAVPGGRMPLQGSLVAFHLAGVVVQLILCAVTAGIVLVAGRIFGGAADFAACYSGMAWYGFVTAFLSPLVLVGWSAILHEQGGFGSHLLLVVGSGLAIWVFAGFVAELHGFRSTAVVVAATLGFVMMTTMLLFSMLQAA
ncbi:MAG: YIP1 family protein [Pseudomonadota bacterium]